MFPGPTREVFQDVPESDRDQDGTEPGRWLAIEAAARRLGVVPKTVRNWIEDDKLRWRPSGNRGREVWVPDDWQSGERPGSEPDPELVELKVQVARLEERLAAGERERDLLRTVLEQSREQTRTADAHVARLEAELAEARKPALVRLIEALRRR
jgi:transposase-like protein